MPRNHNNNKKKNRGDTTTTTTQGAPAAAVAADNNNNNNKTSPPATTKAAATTKSEQEKQQQELKTTMTSTTAPDTSVGGNSSQSATAGNDTTATTTTPTTEAPSSNTEKSTTGKDEQESTTTTTKETPSPNAPNLDLDRPLHAEWTLWFDNPRFAAPGSDWKDNLKSCARFASTASFWRAYNNVKPPSLLAMNSNYSLFRNGIEPTWEDPANVNGGKFVLTMGKKETRAGKCNEYWLFTVLAVIGETMDATGTQVLGAVVSLRKSQDRIALWLRTADPELCIRIGERWKKILHLDGKTTIRYQTHKDAAASGRSFRNEVQFEV